jgi:outer membrane protein assembly factor BamB
MTTMVLRTVVLALAAVVFTAPVGAENWPQWRGPALNGSSKATSLPDKLDPKQNLAWSVKLPGPGAGTPIVWDQRVFVSALDGQSKKLLAMCLDRKDGRVLWRKEVGLGFTSNQRNNMASPSPITDGKTVWFYYGTGDLAAFDFEGKQLWARNIEKDYGPFHVQWIYGSSPLLYDGKLYVQVLHRDVPSGGGRRRRGGQGGGEGAAAGAEGAKPAESYLLALDPQTGTDVWRVVRTDDAREESKESYGTPVPFEGSPRKEIVVIGGDAVTGHDAQSGKELWRVGGWNPEKIGHWRIVPSVLAAEGIAVACAPKGGPVMAIKAGGEGDVTDSHVIWRSKDFTSDVCVPLYYKNQLYVLDGDAKKFHCVDLKTGKVKWSGSLGGDSVFRASPTGADGKIYCMNERGGVWVLSADEFKVLYKGDLGTGGDYPTRSTISVADGHVFVRTSDTLYCFKK